MDTDVPYMGSNKNLHAILDKIQKAGVPDAFGVDFVKDLGFTSSNDRSITKLLKFLGMLDSAGKPQSSYKEFVNHTKARAVLAARLYAAYDDLFLADKEANVRSVEHLKGWFKTKTGVGDAVAKKIATTFKSLASYADFKSAAVPTIDAKEEILKPPPPPPPLHDGLQVPLGLTYRIEIHLPDTSNIDTFRAIFRALREELVS